MKVFTTGQVAKICQVAPATVNRWFDKGMLKGFRVPGSRDRRVPRENLIRFCKEYKLPIGDLGDREAALCVLLIFADMQLLGAVKESFLMAESVRILSASGVFAATRYLQEQRLDAVIIDLGIGHAEASTLCKLVHESKYCLHAVTVGLYDGRRDVKSSRFTDLIRKPFDPQYLVERVKTLVAEARK